MNKIIFILMNNIKHSISNIILIRMNKIIVVNLISATITSLKRAKRIPTKLYIQHCPHHHLHREEKHHRWPEAPPLKNIQVSREEYQRRKPEDVFPMHKQPEPLPVQGARLPPGFQWPRPCVFALSENNTFQICVWPAIYLNLVGSINCGFSLFRDPLFECFARACTSAQDRDCQCRMACRYLWLALSQAVGCLLTSLQGDQPCISCCPSTSSKMLNQRLQPGPKITTMQSTAFFITQISQRLLKPWHMTLAFTKASAV